MTFFSNLTTTYNNSYDGKYTHDAQLDMISNIIEKYKSHPSILKIKENVQVEQKFHFYDVSSHDIKKLIGALDKQKSSTFNNIPIKILIENSDIVSPVISSIYNKK